MVFFMNDSVPNAADQSFTRILYQGCLQYHTGVSGLISSFNYIGKLNLLLVGDVPPIVNYASYQICTFLQTEKMQNLLLFHNSN